MTTRSDRNVPRLPVWLLLVGAAACAPEPVPSAAPGSPLPGLTAQQTADFNAGRAIFMHHFTEQEGLGPAFNDNECSACHDLPAIGGAGADAVRKATRFENGQCSLLTEAGGDLLQNQTTAFMHNLGITAEPVPPRANGFATITPPPLFGLGAIEAIPDEAILKRADPDDKNGDGISGRPGRSFSGRLGRFGRKATFATLHEFVSGALSGEMGLTNPGFPQEEGIGGAALPVGADQHPDPEMSADAVDKLTRFIELLAPPEPPKLGIAARDSVNRGEELFMAIGCGECHTPTLPTRASEVAGLSKRELRLFSDLLLHDLGAELASVCSPDASPSEWRTAPLIGLRYQPSFMSQGQARSIDKAVRMHGGEAEITRKRFEALTPEQRTLVLHFLSTL